MRIDNWKWTLKQRGDNEKDSKKGNKRRKERMKRRMRWKTKDIGREIIIKMQWIEIENLPTYDRYATTNKVSAAPLNYLPR